MRKILLHKMEVKVGYPPNYAAIEKRFCLDGYQPIFAYGNTIYNPHGVEIGSEIINHEKTHGYRQGADPEKWWDRYMDEDNFRLAEELLSHAVELFTRVSEMPKNNRNARRILLTNTTERLISPMYDYRPRLSYEKGLKLLRWVIRNKEKSFE
jgi:hypothetical protein